MDESTRRGVKIGIILIGLIFWVAVCITAVFVTLSFSYVEYYEVSEARIFFLVDLQDFFSD